MSIVMSLEDVMKFATDCNDKKVMAMPREELEMCAVKFAEITKVMSAKICKLAKVATAFASMALYETSGNPVHNCEAKKAIVDMMQSVEMPPEYFIMAELMSKGYEPIEGALKKASEIVERCNATPPGPDGNPPDGLLNGLIDSAIKESKKGGANA